MKNKLYEDVVIPSAAAKIDVTLLLFILYYTYITDVSIIYQYLALSMTAFSFLALQINHCLMSLLIGSRPLNVYLHTD